MARKAERTWIVVVDATDPDLDIAEVRTFITTSGDISNWWNYIPGTYIVKSNLGPDELSDRLKPLTRDARFLVMQVEPTESEGWLPERAWRWIRRRSREREDVAAVN